MNDVATRRPSIISAIQDYGKQLFSFIRGRVGTEEEAEDILQDVWYQFSNYPNAEQIESVSGWLYSVARNRITDNYRKKKTARLDDFDGDDDESVRFSDLIPAEILSPEDESLKDLFWQELMTALSELPEKQREVFILNEIEDFTLQEIADMKNEKLKTIISRKGYAVKYLRKQLENLYNEFINE